MKNAKNDNMNIDEKLAEFTDRTLEKPGKEDKNPFSPNPELRRLEQTAQRLKNAFPEDGPSEAAVQRMHQNIFSRWQRQEGTAGEGLWKRWISMLRPAEQKWRSQRMRQRWGIVGYLAVLVVFAIASLPLLHSLKLGQLAASGQTLTAGKYAAIALLILGLAVLFFRRKQ